MHQLVAGRFVALASTPEGPVSGKRRRRHRFRRGALANVSGRGVGLRRNDAANAADRFRICTGRRVRVDEVSVDRSDESEPDRRSAVADRADDGLVTRPFHVRVGDTHDQVAHVDSGHLSADIRRYKRA